MSTGLISEKTKGLYAKLNERVEAATGSYSLIGDSLQYIYFVPVTKIHRNIQSRCLVHELFFTDILDDINHDYRAAPANICWSSTCLEYVLKTCLEDVFNTSSA